MSLDRTHRYIGPTTKWGLNKGTEVRIVGKRAGGKIIRDKSGRQWIVAATTLEKVTNG